MVDYKKHHTDGLRRKIICGSVLVVAGGAYLWHRKQINTLVEAWQGVRDDTMWSSFDSGVQYGIALAQRLAAGEVVSTDDVKAAFQSFDKAAA